MAEPTTPGSCSFQPTMDCIPGNALGSSDGRFVQAFDAKSCDLVKDRATVLESMIRCAGCRAERLPASPAPVSTTLPPCGLVETVADDLSTSGLPRQGALPLGQLRLFIGGDLVDARTDGFKLSLKLYHRSELRLGYQQSIAEAPPEPLLSASKDVASWRRDEGMSW
jgi:hypothetical protein